MRFTCLCFNYPLVLLSRRGTRRFFISSILYLFIVEIDAKMCWQLRWPHEAIFSRLWTLRTNLIGKLRQRFAARNPSWCGRITRLRLGVEISSKKNYARETPVMKITPKIVQFFRNICFNTMSQLGFYAHRRRDPLPSCRVFFNELERREATSEFETKNAGCGSGFCRGTGFERVLFR